MFFRLQVVPIELPALRERGLDREILAKYFLEEACNTLDREQLELSKDLIDFINNYEWPGNVRELRNLCERFALLIKGDTVTANDLPKYLRVKTRIKPELDVDVDIPAAGLDLKQTVSEFEAKLIVKALKKTNGNKQAAAKLLGLKRTTLIEKLKKYSLTKKIEIISD